MIRFFATGFYLGLSPRAPGTVGTIGAIPLVLLFNRFGPLPYMLAAWLLVLFAIVISQLYERKFGMHDSAEIVIDEIAGYTITLTWLPLTWQAWVLSFFLFRALDILKPLPLNWIDQKVKGGTGVVADDVAAGIIANMILQWLYVNTTLLGSQLG